MVEKTISLSNVNLKVCFVGMGSIGTRHLKNLQKVAKEKQLNLEIHALRNTTNKLTPENEAILSKQISNISEIEDSYDIIFITNPTAMHYDYIKSLVNYGQNMFIEKPLFDHTKYDVEDININSESIYYVAAPMRYTDTFLYIKNFIQNKKIFSARIICSSFMPEWQKGRDYTKSFRTDKKAGGGVDIDLIHEIDYMVDLFGLPNSVKRVAGHYSNLNMNACDLAVYIFSYNNFVVEMHLDYFGRFDKREIELYYNDDVVIGDFINKEVKYLRSNNIVKFDSSEDHYYREMSAFIDMILNRNHTRNINDIYNAYKVLKLAKGEL
ncbi:Gfo/Idh/MocA family protein [Bacillus sp. V5-8f]|uniref:Gfo/Idh/MocA family protein n=1 Tax=Bacillus sp. V5-8f TaxID=2053044 RepID=UPI000C77C162|nr:Gfo/Idh/MocA family oxidoreductase [Bacillus sp. V5-8f]PLT35483.1 oxidoreductase [Bacillus sp. V5-8f]